MEQMHQQMEAKHDSIEQAHQQWVQEH